MLAIWFSKSVFLLPVISDRVPNHVLLVDDHGTFPVGRSGL